MKKFMLIALLLATLPLFGQGIADGSSWFDGTAQYQAEVRAGGAIVYFSGGTPHEGGFEFTIERKSQGRYVLIPSRQAEDFTPVGPFGWKVELTEIDGERVLVVRNPQGRATHVLTQTTLSCTENMERDDVSILEGSYSTEQVGFLGHGCTHRLDADGCKMGNGDTYGAYEFMKEYDMPVNVVSKSGRLWMLVPTVLGMNVYPARPSDDEGYEKAGEAVHVYWSEPMSGRFIIASRRLLNAGILGHYSREALRLMRNEILARHGYKFQSEELSDYFLKQSWYSPLPGNDNITLSDVETLNISLIQSEEARPDDERYPVMEEE